MKILFILNEAPYGSEKTYNALRIAMALQKDQPGTEVLVFLVADAVTAALPAQTTPQGYYNVERMVKSVFLQVMCLYLQYRCYQHLTQTEPIFLIIVAAAHYAKSSALLANSLDNLGDALTYGRTRPVLNTPSDGVITHAWNTGAM